MIFKKKVKKPEYDRKSKRPVIHASICTGERVAGFKDLHTGKFEEIMLIRNDKDLNEFMGTYNVLEEEIVKEW